MSSLTILINYDGKWVNSTYKNCKTKALLVSDKITIEELRNKVYDIVNVDRNEYEITMKVIYDAMKSAWPAEIVDDDDMRAFIFESLSRTYKIPLCITLKRKIFSCGSNQPMPMDLNLGTQADLEDNDQYHDSENDLENAEIEDSEYEEENNTTQLDELLCENIQFEDMPHVEVDNAFQDNVEFNDLPCENMGCDDVPTINVHSDEPNSNKPNARNKDKNNVHGSDMTELCNASGDIIVGQVYETKEDIKTKLGIDAMKKNYEFKVKRSNKERFEVSCVDDRCMWKLRASKVRKSSYVMVKKYFTKHSCSLDAIHRHHRQTSSSLIGQFIKSKYDGVSRVHRPHDIMEDMRKDMGVSISYVKAWRAREHALELVRGSPEESYAILPSYCAMLEAKNPGTITHIETDSNNHFMYFFMSLGPCIRGFRTVIRPVIALDGTFLKGKYRGTLFVATCKDGNNQIYPIAFGVGDSENDASWNWFLTKLRGAIGDINDLVFISDRHESIRKAISTIFPDAHHGACIFHISQNLKNHFKHERAHSLYFRAAKAYLVHEFDRLMVQIFNIDSKVGDYLNAAGYEKWARAHFNGKRYNLMTTNIAECFNSITRDARKLPITNFMEYLRMNILQKWFHERRTEAAKMDSHLTEWA
ncbi:unnamed protein product, partial [Prunus brigantina]